MSTLKNLLDIVNAAIVMRQPLKPVEGDDAVIFPPTFADVGYNIDELVDRDGCVTGNVCLIDSVGSQANRIEPVFLDEPYASLVPKIIVTAPKTEQTVNVLLAGHRIADAIVRFSDLSDSIKGAFEAAAAGNAELLAKLAPTSLVFGCWDSRETGAKLPRVVRSTIRARNVHKLSRSAQYVPATENYDEEFDNLTAAEKKKFPDVGMAHVPAPDALGGVLLTDDSELLREAVLSLSALRRLKSTTKNSSADTEATKQLQAYILGLSLIAFTAPQDTFLRMGCELTPDPDKPAKCELVKTDGTREDFSVSHDDALAFAKKAAEAFGVGKDRTAIFDATKARKALKKKDKDQES